MALWDWLRRGLVGDPELPEPAPLPALSPDEAHLRGLLARLAEASDEAEGAAARAGIGDRDFWLAVARMVAGGHERTALDLVGRFAAACPQNLELKARLAELYCDRHQHAAAVPLLERLLDDPSHALRAHLLLAEAAEQRGDEAAARRHLEAIIAVDLDYPQARNRADRLRHALLDMAPPAAPTLAGLPVGETATGRYRLLRELGRGSSGAVYVAHDEELDREVALKILHPEGRAAARADARARAFTEARVAAAIRHPGVVSIYDLDEEHQLIAMELCQGGALRTRLGRGPLSPLEALERTAELCETLEAVHRRGVVHGDVTPANLLFRREGGELVLGDFGLALIAESGPPAREARGTLGYMAPEQRLGEAGPAADLYPAGVILLECLRGRPNGSGLAADRSALLRGDTGWDGQLPAGLGDAAAPLSALISALVAPDPAARPQAGRAAAELRTLAAVLKG